MLTSEEKRRLAAIVIEVVQAHDCGLDRTSPEYGDYVGAMTAMAERAAEWGIEYGRKMGAPDAK